jgi:hypothetical protein
MDKPDEFPRHPNCRSEIFFNGVPLNVEYLMIIPTVDLEGQRQIALRYCWKRLLKDRDYLSLQHMSRETGLSYDQCENFVTEFHAQRLITRMQILEEVEE